MAYCARHSLPSRRHEAFCRLFGAEKIVEYVGGFLGHFMVRKVAASEELLRTSGTVMAKRMAWLAEHAAPGVVVLRAEQADPDRVRAGHSRPRLGETGAFATG
jgi:hypothetical protein